MQNHELTRASCSHLCIGLGDAPWGNWRTSQWNVHRCLCLERLRDHICVS